jgi:hypothetical protein
LVQDEDENCDFDGEEAAAFLEGMSERIRQTEAASFDEIE